jgi:hypothetical protein
METSVSPQPGDFACVHTNGDVGTLITIGQFLNGDRASWYDHACIYVGLPDAKAPHGYVMGAQPSGARLNPLMPAQYTGRDAAWLWSTGKISPTDDQRKQIVSLALSCRGVPYSAADYFALAAHRLHVPVPGLKDFIASSGHMICSQMVDWCEMRAGVHLFPDGRWPGYVTPAMLAGLIGA